MYKTVAYSLILLPIFIQIIRVFHEIWPWVTKWVGPITGAPLDPNSCPSSSPSYMYLQSCMQNLVVLLADIKNSFLESQAERQSGNFMHTFKLEIPVLLDGMF